jgi:hypothetical protein
MTVGATTPMGGPLGLRGGPQRSIDPAGIANWEG